MKIKNTIYKFNRSFSIYIIRYYKWKKKKKITLIQILNLNKLKMCLIN